MEKKRLRIFAAVAGVTVLLGLLLPGYTKLQDLISKNKKMETKINELTAYLNRLEKEKDALENDMLYIERIAREKLGVAREDEIVIKEKP